MNIKFPENIEQSINAAVQSGYFASADEMVARIVQEYFQSHQLPAANQERAGEAQKPIWELIEEDNRTIPPEVWDALPTDLAEQHDHYLYGTPKRPTA